MMLSADNTTSPLLLLHQLPYMVKKCVCVYTIIEWSKVNTLESHDNIQWKNKKLNIKNNTLIVIEYLNRIAVVAAALHLKVKPVMAHDILVYSLVIPILFLFVFLEVLLNLFFWR